MAQAVPVLMYHEVAPEDQVAALSKKTYRGYILSNSAFDDQMRFLADNGFQTLTPGQLAQAVLQNSWSDLPAKSVLITFDDGFAGNYHHALPILQRYHFTAVFFVIVNSVGTERMMNWSQLEALLRSGMSVGSHLMNHVAMAELTRQRAGEELADSRRILGQRLAAEVPFLSLPHGSHHRDYAACAREAGYTAGFCSQPGFVHPGSDPFLLERIAIVREIDIQRFSRLAHGKSGVLQGARLKKQLHRIMDRCLGESRVNRLYHRVHRISHPHEEAR